MAAFAIYDMATGAVKRTGRSTNPDVLDLERSKLGTGEALFEGEIDPSAEYLPDGVPAPKPVEIVTIDPVEVKAWAGRLLSYTDWYVTRNQETGAPIPDEVLVYRQAVRDASGIIEAMDPIPVDFRNPGYWPEAL